MRSYQRMGCQILRHSSELEISKFLFLFKENVVTPWGKTKSLVIVDYL